MRSQKACSLLEHKTGRLMEKQDIEVKSVEIKYICIQIGDKEIKITPEEAKNLRDKLSEVLGNNTVQVITVPAPITIPYTPYIPPYQPIFPTWPTITCRKDDSTSDIFDNDVVQIF
jgi:hypothetical protein